MKVVVLTLAVIAACMGGAVQQIATSGDSQVAIMEPDPDLTIVVDVRLAGGISYALLWKATVKRVVHGDLPDRAFELNLSPDPGGERYSGRFQSVAETSVKLRLRKLPEMPFALQGFVAADGTAWQLVDVDAK